MQAIRQSYCNIIAGACLSIALRYAGTANPAARDVVLHYVGWFADLRSRKIRGLSSMRHGSITEVDRITIETGLSVLALCVGVVMSGTGDVTCLRVLRGLRTSGGRPLDKHVTYGHHQALAMAIGFLFLGGGRYALTTSTPAVAALVVALYPRFASTPSDNRYHLQAFR